MNATRNFPFAGRLLIGVAFAMSGLSKLAAYDATIALITSSKLPLPAPLARNSHTIFARSSRFARRFADVFRGARVGGVGSTRAELGFFLGCGCSEEEQFPVGLRMIPRG
jgi:uncharacterized membrane protein YphA (DoxX/SURF4 family)